MDLTSVTVVAIVKDIIICIAMENRLRIDEVIAISP